MHCHTKLEDYGRRRRDMGGGARRGNGDEADGPLVDPFSDARRFRVPADTPERAVSAGSGSGHARRAAGIKMALPTQGG